MELHTSATQISDRIHRLTLAPNEHFEFSQFLILDDKCCLIHTGNERLYPSLKPMVAKLLGSRKLDYIVFSHFEADESGSVNHWLADYPDAVVACNRIANINLGDVLIRPPQILNEGEKISLGRSSLRLINTPHFPHNWDAHMWYNEEDRILFSSDFCCHDGISQPIAEGNPTQKIIKFYEKGGFIPYGKSTNEALAKLSLLSLKTIAPMHGSVIFGEELCRSVFNQVRDDLVSRS